MFFRYLRGASGALSVALVGAVFLSPCLARADDAAPADNVSKARELFSEARKLVQDGNYAQACGKFEESLKLNVGIGTQFNLADCWEHVGRTASARSLFLGAAASAHALGQAEREQVAKARADALEPRLLRLVIDVRATDAELVIRRNQVPIERESWSTATAVDPGAYLIEASAPGKKSWSARVTVPATATETVSVTVPPLEDAAAACEPKSANSEAPIETKPLPLQPPDAPTPLADEPPSRSARRTAYALSLAGLGIASLGVGTVLAIEYQSKNDDAKTICPSSVGCSASDIDDHSGLVSDAKTFRTWSFVGFGVGGAALVGAAVLYFAPSSSGERASGFTAASFTAAPFVAGNGTWGAVASGKF
jgi:hypothetical protein